MIKYGLILLAFLSIFSCQNSQEVFDKQKQLETDSMLIEKLSKENADLTNGVFAETKNIEDYRVILEEIEQQLAEIDEKSSKIITLSKNANEDKMLEDDIMSHLKHINASLHNVRLKSNHLHESHQTISNNNSIPQDSLEILRKELHLSINKVIEKEKEIDKMHEEMAIEGDYYKDLYSEYQDQKSYSEVLFSIIHTKFYFVGTKEELLEKGIVKNADDKVLIPNADANDGLFKAVDVDKQNVIELNSDSINLISVHPVGSYELVGENPITGLKILDYKLFWDKTEFLIIEVK